MKIKEVLESARKQLIDAHIDDGTIIARNLLAYTLNVDKQYLLINEDEEIKEEFLIKYRQYINKILQGEPIQYIVHNQEFMGLNFYLDKNVLIPQPDTEVLVEQVLQICQNNYKEKYINILDLCTGSGAIAISLDKILASKGILANIVASDISATALQVAQRNNEKNNTNVRFVLSDLFKSRDLKKSNDKFDVIVSNPPYVKTDIINKLSMQVRNEPVLALDGGRDGLKFYRRIIKEAYKYINNGGYLCLEIGYDQREEVLELVKKYKQYTDTQVVKDLSQNDRCVVCRVLNV